MLLSPLLSVPGLSPLPSISSPGPLVEKYSPDSTIESVFKARLELSTHRSPVRPGPEGPETVILVCRTSEAKFRGMSCCVPIFRAAGLLVLRTMEGEEVEGEGVEEEQEPLESWRLRRT